jgi:DNA invertase Pin-like site-specific DNA recombinase
VRDGSVAVGKLIRSARVSTQQQDADRRTTDLLAAGIRRDDLHIDHGVSGARASRPAFDEALRALHDGDTLVITTLDRLGGSTQNMLALAGELRGRGASLRILDLGGGDVDTATPMGSMAFTVMAALAQMELDIERERITDSVSKRRAAGEDLGGRRQAFTDSQVTNGARLIDAGEPAAQVARSVGMSRATLHRRLRDIQRAESAGAITSRERRRGCLAQPPFTGLFSGRAHGDTRPGARGWPSGVRDVR